MTSGHRGSGVVSIIFWMSRVEHTLFSECILLILPAPRKITSTSKKGLISKVIRDTRGVLLRGIFEPFLITLLLGLVLLGWVPWNASRCFRWVHDILNLHIDTRTLLEVDHKVCLTSKLLRVPNWPQWWSSMVKQMSLLFHIHAIPICKAQHFRPGQIFSVRFLCWFSVIPVILCPLYTIMPPITIKQPPPEISTGQVKASQVWHASWR